MPRPAQRYLGFTDWITESAVAVYMVIIINGYVALSELNTQFYYIIGVDIGACIAWGFIDGFTNAIGGSIDRGKEAKLVREIRSEKDQDKALKDVMDELDNTFVSRFSPEGKTAIAKEIVRNSENTLYVKQRFMTRGELLGLLSILSIYVVAGIALSLPYIILPNKVDAWFVSNIFGVAWLFYYGLRVGRIVDGKKILIGLITAGAGIAFLLISYFVYA